MDVIGIQQKKVVIDKSNYIYLNNKRCEDYIDTTTCAAAFDGLTCIWYTPLDSCTSISKAIEFDR